MVGCSLWVRRARAETSRGGWDLLVFAKDGFGVFRLLEVEEVNSNHKNKKQQTSHLIV